MMNKSSDIWDKPSKEWEQAIMSNQNILEELKNIPYMACGCYDPDCENRTYKIKDLEKFISQQKAELKKLITEEIVTCQKIGEPTSRLTSLYNKI